MAGRCSEGYCPYSIDDRWPQPGIERRRSIFFQEEGRQGNQAESVEAYDGKDLGDAEVFDDYGCALAGRFRAEDDMGQGRIRPNPWGRSSIRWTQPG